MRGDPLPARYREHRLKGDYAGYFECHIQPDWLMIYAVTDSTIELARTGTHTELFDKHRR